MTVCKASNRSVIVYRSRGQLGASSVYSSGGFIKVFTDARGGLITVYKVNSGFITVYRSIE
jgi:hypothetical protein